MIQHFRILFCNGTVFQWQLTTRVVTGSLYLHLVTGRERLNKSIQYFRIPLPLFLNSALPIIPSSPTILQNFPSVHFLLGFADFLVNTEICVIALLSTVNLAVTLGASVPSQPKLPTVIAPFDELPLLFPHFPFHFQIPKQITLLMGYLWKSRTYLSKPSFPLLHFPQK